ncbi:MAG: hypothetical protein JOZ54_21625 [Acidobacteria bacterium]|nr:hypothetical protein [Acidobacteriota bacterium]
MALLAVLLAAAAEAQTLDCAPGAAGTTRSCDVFHYHVAMYRPDRKPITEVWGLNAFSSMSACDRARQAYIDRSLAVLDYFKRVKNEQQWEPDRVGQCHCDRSTEPGNGRYLSDAQRQQQLRTAEEIREIVRERLLDAKVPSDSDLVRGLTPRVTTNALLSGSKLVPLPAPVATPVTTLSANDLRPTKAADVSTPAVVTVDLPLVEIPLGGPTTPPVETAAATTVDVVAVPAPQPAASAPAPTSAPVVTTPAPAPAPVPQATWIPAPSPQPPPQPQQQVIVVSEQERAAADEVAERFIRYETARVQNIITAADRVTDEAVKSKIYDAITLRLQVLPNLRLLIQGSGIRSRLATMARDAGTEDERLALVSRLFGSDLRKHWAPQDAADVVIESNPDLEADPERILRDTSGRIPEAQRKRALYLLLGRNQPTEAQQLWLQTVIEELLR